MPAVLAQLRPADDIFPMQSARGYDWVSTVLQGGPKLVKLARHAAPTLRIDSVASLYPETIRSLGAHGIIWDVDGTLMPRHGSAVAPHLAAAFARLRGDPMLRHVILSNCDAKRFADLATIFTDIPILRVYARAGGIIVRRRLGESDSCTPGTDVSRLDSVRALRKPNVLMVRAALDELRCTSPSQAVMIGDQYLTDVAPANMLGVATVKVDTIEPGSFPMPVRALQLAERLLVRMVASHR